MRVRLASRLAAVGLALLGLGCSLLVLLRVSRSDAVLVHHDSHRASLGEARPHHHDTRYGTLSWAQPHALDRCDTWPSSSASLREHIDELGIPNPGEYGWQCVGYSRLEVMPAEAVASGRRASRAGAAAVSMEACEAWCESTHDPSDATTGNWCCQWQPTSNSAGWYGECAWADGLARFLKIVPDKCVPVPEPPRSASARALAARTADEALTAENGAARAHSAFWEAPEATSEGASRPTGRVCMETLAYEACTVASRHFAAVAPDIAAQGLVSAPQRKPDRTRTPRPSNALRSTHGGLGRGSPREGEVWDGGDDHDKTHDRDLAAADQIWVERNHVRQFAERPPASACRLDDERGQLETTMVPTLALCSEACFAWPDNGCAAFAFSRARAERGQTSCALLSRCRGDHRAPGEWASFQRKSEELAARERLAPLQLGAPLGMAARLAGDAGAGGEGITPEEHAPCPPEGRAFVMQGEGAGTCSQFCLDKEWWAVAEQHRVQQGECRLNGCAIYLASRKQAGTPFDLYRCQCPTFNRTALYSCISIGMPALT